MEWLYIVFCILGIWAECSTKIDTRNILKKIALFIVISGCLVELSGNENNLIEYGAMLYIVADLYRKFKESSCHKNL
jgi:hypothetical protein